MDKLSCVPTLAFQPSPNFALWLEYLKRPDVKKGQFRKKIIVEIVGKK